MGYSKEDKTKYIAGEGMDFFWDVGDVVLLKSMYNNGFSILEMSAVVERHTDEIAILFIDLTRNGEIRFREKGLFGVNAY
jgi:hypothetical protein